MGQELSQYFKERLNSLIDIINNVNEENCFDQFVNYFQVCKEISKFRVELIREMEDYSDGLLLASLLSYLPYCDFLEGYTEEEREKLVNDINNGNWDSYKPREDSIKFSEYGIDDCNLGCNVNLIKHFTIEKIEGNSYLPIFFGDNPTKSSIILTSIYGIFTVEVAENSGPESNLYKIAKHFIMKIFFVNAKNEITNYIINAFVKKYIPGMVFWIIYSINRQMDTYLS